MKYNSGSDYIKNNIKYTIIFFAVVSLLLCGCTNNDSDEKTDNNTPVQEIGNGISFNGDYPKIEEIEYQFYNGVYYDEEAALFGYINNSEYTIVYLELEFKIKPDITSEEISAFDSVKSDYNISDDEITQLTPVVRDYMVCDPGEAVSGSTCDLKADYKAANENQCKLMELTSGKISYIGNDGLKHTVAFSMENNSYSFIGGSEDIYEWSQGTYASIIPVPSSRIIQVDHDREDYYQFTSYDITPDQFIAYCNECKTSGFDRDIEESLYSYQCTNEQGLKLHIRFFPYMMAMQVSIE